MISSLSREFVEHLGGAPAGFCHHFPDTGIDARFEFVAGDIRVSLANVELLTIQLRLVICSIDKAEAIGINWWRSDRFYSAAPNAGAVSAEEYDALKARMNELEAKLEGRALPRATQTKPDERKGR